MNLPRGWELKVFVDACQFSVVTWASTFMSISQIDNNLRNYYKQKNASYDNDEGIGKFLAWTEENGYETDDVLE